MDPAPWFDLHSASSLETDQADPLHYLAMVFFKTSRQIYGYSRSQCHILKGLYDLTL